MQTLKQLIDKWAKFARENGYAEPPSYAGINVGIGRFIEDSRQIKAGDCFVARVRQRPDGTLYSDGRPYIEQAITRGATAILAPDPPATLPLTIPDHVAYYHVPDTAIALAWLAAAFYDFPAHKMTVIGVTGTDGKTTVVNMLYEVLRTTYKTGMISTIKAVIGDHEEPTGLHVTTPQAPEIQAFLRRMADDGVTHCILEATSMGLAEHRADTAFFDIGIVTNITHEHIDYHGDYAGYLAAKARLLDLAQHCAIINADDISFPHLDGQHGKQVVYGIDAPAGCDVWADEVRFSAETTTFNLQPATINISSPLVGKFNVYNMLAAASAAWQLGVSSDNIKGGLEALDIISGRMERINAGQSFLTIVDFAHTPNALLKAIQAARGMTDGRIITVFGSAGRRDVAKRRMMAEVSSQSADLTILTAEDPRQEPLTDILAMMAEGCVKHGGIENETFWRVPDRGRAIYFALTLAHDEDLVLICGKGHEQSMCFDTTEYDWDDRAATHAALQAFLRDEPMVDLGLPTFAK